MLNQHLSNLEQEIMDVIWRLEECTVRDVIKAREGQKNLAYTTIATIVDRLYSKSIVKRVQKGKQYVYIPLISKEEFGKNVAATFIQRFMKNFGDVAIASFAESIDELPDKKRASLIDRIKQHEKK
jgi:predicted transcriptional regulator